MSKQFLCIVVLLVTVATAASQDRVPEATHVVITIATGIDQKGDLQLVREAKKAGEVKNRPNTVPLGDARVFDTDGKQLSLDEARKFITGETPVLIVHTGSKMPSAHLQVIKKGTLIFVFPQQRRCFLSGNIRQILTKEKYEKIMVGMTLQEVYAVLNMGPDNERLGQLSNDVDPDATIRVSWLDPYGQGISVTLQGNEVISKSEEKLESVGQ